MKGLTQWTAGIRQGLLPGVMILLAGCATINDPVTPRMTPYVPAVSPADLAFASPVVASTAGAVVDGNVPEVRGLRNGDKIGISLLGIPTPYSGNDEIDENGSINLPLIGNQKISGLTTAEAELAIENAYIDKQIFKQINAVIVAESEEYYVRGEVRQPGKYPLTTGTTLLRAVVSAGGYTEFAQPRKITIKRGDKVETYDTKRIESLQDPDPVINPDDIIVVDRRFIL